MSPLTKTLSRCALLAMSVVASSGFAGQDCSEKPLAPQDVRAGLQLALKTRDALDQSGAEVAILARVGRDLSAYHLRYSHVGFAWRDHPRGQWTVVNELNDCGTAKSALYDEGIGNFFLDNMYAYETEVVIPSKAVQHRIASGLSNRVGEPMHEPRYNLVSYAWGTRYQNSNQWLLETLASALSERTISSRAQAQTWLRAEGYQPSTVHVDALTRLGGELFRANVAFNDHPLDRRIAGEIDLVSAESVLEFAQRIDPCASARVLAVDTPVRAKPQR